MKRQNVALTALVWVTLVTAVLAHQQQGPNELLGEWKIVSGSHAGQVIPQSQLPTVVLKIEKDGHWTDPDGMVATWSTDETKKPKTLDLEYTAGPDRGKKQLCVYEVVGDRLTIVMGVPGAKEADRPSSLATTPEKTKVVLFNFERIKKVTSEIP